VFGIIRPCRNRLGDELAASWLAHLCGTCLALRDRHGHLARLVTNYDAVVVSALVEAQRGTDRRDAGPCALRGLRGASVAVGPAAELAAAVSLVLASAKIADHLADGDLAGPLRRRAAEQVATRWSAAGQDAAAAVGVDAGALLAAVQDQALVEASARTLLEVTAPTEAATALAFAHTATVAGRPENADALAEAGRLFGRLAHVLDAVEDVAADRAAGRWNPLAALAVPPAEARRVCDDAVLGIRLALRDATFADGRLVHALLVHELPRSVERAFTATAPGPPLTPPLPPGQQPPGAPFPPPIGWDAPPPDAKRNGPWRACVGWLVACGTCQVCCADEYTDPCTGQRRRGICGGCDANCCDCCSGCDGCDACDCCDCGCDC